MSMASIFQRAAEREKRTPQEQADYISGELKRCFTISGSIRKTVATTSLMRTTQPFHYEGVRHLWREIAKNKTPKGMKTFTRVFTKAGLRAVCRLQTEDEYVFPDRV
jgi:hypothetical protein